MFLFTKFTEGAWVVVIAVAALYLLFLRSTSTTSGPARSSNWDRSSPDRRAKRTEVIVPVACVSRGSHAACHLDEALSLGQEVIAVYVLLGSDDEVDQEECTRERWTQWDPGVPLKVLRTEYASVVEPLVAFIDGNARRHQDQIVVLIPVVVPDRFRYRILHNQIDLVLSQALKSRTDLVVARAKMSLDLHPETNSGPGEIESISPPLD